MRHEDVKRLAESDPVISMPSYQASGIRGAVTQVTENFVRIDWRDSAKSYDILRRTSPLWKHIERL